MHIFTQKKRYSNYKLHVEWRWVTKPTNSGVLLHAEGDEFWPNCVEAQLQAGNAGDFVIMGIGTAMTVEGVVYTNEDSRYTVIPKQHESNEKSAGEWNEYDIVCDGAAISITVNGVLQNKGVDGTRMKGHIALQSEGSHVQFRNVYIEKITK